MGMAAILFNGVKPFNKLSTSFLQRTLCEILVTTVQAVSEKKAFKDFTILCMYRAQGQGQITPKILTVAKQFYYFNHSL